MISLSLHHANGSVQCRAPYFLFLYRKTEVYSGIHVFLFFFCSKTFVDELEDGHANRTTNLLFVPHQLRRVRLGP